MRVFGDISEKSLDIAVVIPSYREGDDILGTLESLAKQKEVDGINFAVFVVVNNARDAATEVLKSNQHTFDVIRAIQGEDMSENFSVCLTEADKKMGKKYVNLSQSNLSVNVIDLFSEENAPEECNVGVARDIGARVALTYLKADGVLAMTDADVHLPSQYISRIQELFSNPNISAATGNFRTQSDRSLESKELKSRYESYHLAMHQIKSIFLFQSCGFKTPWL